MYQFFRELGVWIQNKAFLDILCRLASDSGGQNRLLNKLNLFKELQYLANSPWLEQRVLG